jgi:hypothetical protein
MFRPRCAGSIRSSYLSREDLARQDGDGGQVLARHDGVRVESRGREGLLVVGNARSCVNEQVAQLLGLQARERPRTEPLRITEARRVLVDRPLSHDALPRRKQNAPDGPSVRNLLHA